MNVAGPADAASPAVVIPSAPLISPSTALAYYGTPTSPTPGPRSALVQELARSLRYDVDLIYTHVRDNVDFVSMFGLQKGARGVILDASGTAFDQAQFMVDLLREADAQASKGYAPAYVVGQITLTGAQFAAWTGVSNASAATRLLGNGGIPATVTVNGGSFDVTMLHVWVRVTIGGTQYLFDPSFKTVNHTAGLNWQAASGYSQAALLAAGGAGGPTSVSGFNVPAFRQQLDAYRNSIEGYLGSGGAGNSAGKRADAVIGARDIVPHTAAEDRRISLPYVTTSNLIWTGDIPNIFRTSFTVALNGSNYATYYADTVGGQTLPFAYRYAGGTFGPDGTPPGPAISGSVLSPCDQWLSNRSTVSPAVATVSIDHPYAANSGTYADRTISRQLTSQNCNDGLFYVTNDWGYTGTGTSSRMAAKASQLRTEPGASSSFIFGPTLANVASQYSALLDMASRTQEAAYQLHDLIGIHTVDSVSLNLNPPNSFEFATMLSMDFEAAVSGISKSGSATGDVTAAYTAGLGLAFIEGAVPRQESDAVYDLAAINLITQQDERANNPGIYQTTLATPSSWLSVRQGLANYPANALSVLDTYASGEQYSVLVPQQGSLRQQRITVTSGPITRTSSLYEGRAACCSGTEVLRSAFLAWHPSAGSTSAPDKIAVVMFDQRRGSILKAGVGVAMKVGATDEAIRKPESPKAEGKDVIRAAVSVNGQTGALTYAPAADLTDGTGDFPKSLSLQRVYDQRDQTNYGMGAGWKSNWYQVATLQNDGNAALGRSGAQAVASSLVFLQSVGDLVTTQDAQHLYASLQVAGWMADQTINNTIVVSRGLDSDQTFYRQASGTFVNAKAEGATLNLTGTPSIGIINRRLYLATDVNYTDNSGSTRHYASAVSSLGRDITSPGIASIFTRKSLYLSDWTFPNGIKIFTSYDSSVAASDVIYLQRVYSNLGNALYQTVYDYGSLTNQPVCRTQGGPVVYDPPRGAVIGYKVPSAAEVRFTMTAQVRWTVIGDPDTVRCAPGTTTVPMTQSPVFSTLNYKTDPLNANWSYGYGAVPTMFGSITSLSAIYKPSNGSPDIGVSWGLDGNVRLLSNLLGYGWQYYSSQFRSEMLAPAEAASQKGDVTVFDMWSQPILSVDPLLRQTRTRFDAFGRAYEVTRPEGDVTLTSFDVRSNPIQVTSKPKPGSSLPDIVTSVGYVTGPTVAACANLAVCNKPAYAIDGRGYRSNYTWHGTYGEMLTQISGLNSTTSACQIADGVCPAVSYTYTSGLSGYDPTSGGTSGSLALLATATTAITSNLSTTTAYNYALKTFGATYAPMSSTTVKKIVPREVIADSGGLTYRTCYQTDTAGNVVSQTTPRGALATCP